MEQEFKWKANDAQFHAICQALHISNIQLIDMDSTYFDTPHHLLQRKKIGLRLRRENEHTVCCMKLRNQSVQGLHTHQEFECPAQTISAGLEGLQRVGAPVALCQQLQKETLFPIAQISFLRQQCVWREVNFSAFLCLDSGFLGNAVPANMFSEIECEYQQGTYDAFVSACLALAQKFSLLPESRSKLARALWLSKV